MAYAEEMVLNPYKDVVDTFKKGLLPNINGHTSRTGALTCFCQKEFKDGKNGDTFFEVASYDGNITKRQVCKHYAQITNTLSIGTATDMTYEYLVVLVNYLIVIVIVKLASYIRFTTKTKQDKFIMITVFCLQFFNSGLLFVLGPWDYRSEWSKRIPLWDKIFHGVYPDINANWFSDIGVTVCNALAYNMFMPFIEFWLDWG